ncbi:MAG: bifunctional phosphoribosyl-AMP cyclohydrolase/phosphoribosyl-ATP diphosphatase HisIE [Legionella sp.]|nr:bifunctional phosphoribosyl-AMP cyclohydrolase/phosphoribosyl-ATP diphosphatase HisIE [Legionella sp.]
MSIFDSRTLDWQKMSGLLPAIIQHADSGNVLMLGYMNKEALEISQTSGQLTLYSRSRQELWRKGATSGNTMAVVSITGDCDGDSLLVQVKPTGAACHLGLPSCFQPDGMAKISFLAYLGDIIRQKSMALSSTGYTTHLLNAGLARTAQKVGEEATEVVIAAVKGDRDELIEESADLLFHLLVLLQASKLDIYAVIDCLKERHYSNIASISAL